MTETSATLPAEMADLPIDPHRGVPIPFMNQRADGTGDFVGIQADRVLRCLAEGLCGICGTKLGEVSAFVGGPVSSTTRTYADPPFHPDCAKAAMRLCPHILIGRAKRASDRRAEHTSAVAGMVLDKPKWWVIGLAATRDTTWQEAPGGWYIRAGQWIEKIRYRYDDDGRLTYPNNG